MTDIDWDKAIDRLKAGRTKGKLIALDGRVCLLGACLVGMGYERHQLSEIDGYDTVRPAATVIAPIIWEQFPDRTDSRDLVDSVFFFNDNSVTTDDEALLVLEKARANS